MTTYHPVPAKTETGGGEMRFCEKKYNSLSCSIASEIVDEILNNAMDIALRKEQKKIGQKSDLISSNLVGDILENIMSTKRSLQDETPLLDEEIKRIINEMKCPPTTTPLISTKGIGDQLESKSEITLPQKPLKSPPPKRNTLERKNRLTNLVRNSKQMLSKFMTNDCDRAVESNDEKEERLVRVINFETSPMTEEGPRCQQEGDVCMIREGNLDDLEMDVIDLYDDKEIGDKASGIVQAACSKDFFKEKEGKKELEDGGKKKGGLGARLMKIFKRNPKKVIAREEVEKN